MKMKVLLIILLGLSCLTERTRAREVASASREKPTIFVCGDSTAKNNDIGKNGQPLVGWGTAITNFFNPAKVTIKNVAHAGRSSLTYYYGDWPHVLPQIHKGDYVLLVFGINDGSTPWGIGNQTVMRNGRLEHTYGWYMAKMATDAEAKGAHVYLLTVTVRNIWTNPKVKFHDATPIGPLPADYNPKQDRIERGTGGGRFTRWTEEIGRKLHIPVFNLTDYAADRYEVMGRVAVNKLYSDHNHTYRAGAKVVAGCIVSGLKAFKASPFIPWLSAKGRAIPVAPAKYVSNNFPPAATADAASVLKVPIRISDIPRSTQMGHPPAPAGAPSHGRYFPPEPANPQLPTLWIIGDSTVRNGTPGNGSNQGQWGWGAPIVAYFNLHKINVVNRAFGGTSSRSFYDGFFWKHLRPQIKKGDFVIMQFGANDSGTLKVKGSIRGVGPETRRVVTRNGKTETVHTYGWYLEQFVKQTREQGATPIICSFTPHKEWTSDGHFRRETSTYVSWAAKVARKKHVLFVDLYDLIARKYQSLGKKVVNQLYVPSPTQKLHTGWDGAVINAGRVIAGLKGLKNDPLAPYFSARASSIAPVVISPAAQTSKVSQK